MDTVEVEKEQVVKPVKKISKDVKLWVVVLSMYLLVCTVVTGFLGWGIASVLKTVAEEKNIPYATATAMAAQWPILFSDDFSKVSNIWYVGTYRGKGYTEIHAITNGEYAWEISSANGYTFWQNAGLEGLSDFVLSVDARHISGSTYDRYGLEFRHVAGNYYLFSIQDVGAYSLFLRSAGNWNEIIASTRSYAIRPGQSNHLTVQAQGSHFQLFINDTYVNQFDDATLAAGDVGMLFSPDNGSANSAPQIPQGVVYSLSSSSSRVVFDNFEVRAPQNASTGSLAPKLPQIRPAPGRLVFVSDRDGNRNIYTINTDGTGLKQLTDDPAADYEPRWSPDGKKVVFVSRRDGNSEIYSMDASGANLTRLTNDAADDMSPDWSPDGKQIIFASRRKSNYDIYIMSVLGEKESLTQLTNTKYDEINPSVSPNGLEVLYQAKKNVIYRPMLMSIAGKGAREIQTRYSDWTGADSAWAPDGLQVAYVEKGGEENEIFILADAHARVADYFSLTQNMGKSLYPSWSPDGKQLVFVSDMDGQPEIYIILADGSGIFRVTHTEAGEESPDWTNP